MVFEMNFRYHTMYQMLNRRSGITAITDGHATWQVTTIALNTEMYIEIVRPTKKASTSSMVVWSDDA
jgi:hypothetical protein